MDPIALLRHLFDTAVARAHPATCLPPALPAPPHGPALVLGAGKAAAAMAEAFEQHWQGPVRGLVVTRYGHGAACRHVEVIEAGHPLPDSAGLNAAQRMLAMAGATTAEEHVFFLVSGGGSSLLSLPAPGIALSEKQAINRALLASGAAIDEINCVRKHLSAIKGGRLALAAAPAPLLTLAISDVPGDDPAVIASGPTVPDPTTCAQARAVLDRHGVPVSAALASWLAAPEAETPKLFPAGYAPRLELIATPAASLTAAAAAARAAGCELLMLGDRIEGEAREVARVLAGIALYYRAQRAPGDAPLVILSGGETTVTVRGGGRGGRNVEWLLALGCALRGAPGIHALAADTDGIDGSEDNAGAWLTPELWRRGQALPKAPEAYLADNDGHGFFSALGSLVTTGPTRTNVNDFRAILID